MATEIRVPVRLREKTGELTANLQQFCKWVDLLHNVFRSSKCRSLALGAACLLNPLRFNNLDRRVEHLTLQRAFAFGS